MYFPFTFLPFHSIGFFIVTFLRPVAEPDDSFLVVEPEDFLPLHGSLGHSLCNRPPPFILPSVSFTLCSCR